MHWAHNNPLQLCSWQLTRAGDTESAIGHRRSVISGHNQLDYSADDIC